MEEIVGLMPSGEEEIKEEENKIVEREDGMARRRPTRRRRI